MKFYNFAISSALILFLVCSVHLKRLPSRKIPSDVLLTRALILSPIDVIF
jgi:hypothetical protein